MYINLKTETVAQKIHAPDTSLPRNPSDATLTALGYARIQPTPRPDGDVVTQGQPEQRDGKWYQAWEVRDFTEAERAERLEQARRDAQRRINDAYQSELGAILGDYPEAETKTWDKQETEARAYQADSTASTPLIDAIASARSMDKAELVSRIIAKADAWIALSGAATGKRQALEDAISAAETLEEVEAIAW